MDNKYSIPGSTKAGVLFKTTLVDYPGKVASAVFLPGCNLRCPYCYNVELVENKLALDEISTFDEIIGHLEKRRNVLKGFVISGGEAILSPLTEPLIYAARKLGYAIKIDTNGIAFEKLERLISNKELCPDFIALDVKTAPSRYGLMAPHLTDPKIKKTLEQSIINSIKLVSSFPTEKREFRTVLVPSLIDESDIRSIASYLPHDASWQFAPFRNENCIDPSFRQITPMTDSKVKSLTSIAKRIIPNALLR